MFWQRVLPEEKFDFIVSLYSLDYHYDFNIYLEYLKNNTHMSAIINYSLFPRLIKTTLAKAQWLLTQA